MRPSELHGGIRTDLDNPRSERKIGDLAEAIGRDGYDAERAANTDGHIKAHRDADGKVTVSNGSHRVAAMRKAGYDEPVPVGGSIAEQGGQSLSKLSDDDLSAELAKAGSDETRMNDVLAELDRRDKVSRDTDARKAAVAAKVAARAKAKEDDYDRRVRAGADPEQAYADAYGTTVHKMRTPSAIQHMRDMGYKGAGFRELASKAFKDELEHIYVAAENATRGALLNRPAMNRHLDPRRLFTGNEAYARANASEELKAWWDEHGRLTFEDYQASILGGSIKERTTGDSWHR